VLRKAIRKVPQDVTGVSPRLFLSAEQCRPKHNAARDGRLDRSFANRKGRLNFLEASGYALTLRTEQGHQSCRRRDNLVRGRSLFPVPNVRDLVAALEIKKLVSD